MIEIILDKAGHGSVKVNGIEIPGIRSIDLQCTAGYRAMVKILLVDEVDVRIDGEQVKFRHKRK